MRNVFRIGLIAGLVLIALLAVWIAWGMIEYPPLYIYRVLAWRDSDAFDWQKFPARGLQPAPETILFDQQPDENVAVLLAELSGVRNWERFLADNETQAFLVLKDGEIRYEGYFNGAQRDSIVTSFSVAKSFTSALIGTAIDEGLIGDVQDPITQYLPELAERDPAFSRVTIQHLLRMTSGFEYQEFRFPGFNSDDPLTTYHPDQRQLALENTRIVDPPGQYFLYNKYHPQLLGMILERTSGSTVTEYLQEKIWDPAGMQYGGSWSLDSQASGFEKMETGVNARAVDFARFGQLYLQMGTWEGEQVVSSSWVEESTSPFLPDDYYPDWFVDFPGQRYYGYMWWGYLRADGTYDFAAAGDKGQYIYVSPANGVVIVRNGIDFGGAGISWPELFYRFVEQYAARDST